MADIFEVFLTFFIIVVALVAVILFIACGKSVVFLNEISCIISRSNATPKLGKVSTCKTIKSVTLYCKFKDLHIMYKVKLPYTIVYMYTFA